jgi:hypothetical protein
MTTTLCEHCGDEIEREDGTRDLDDIEAIRAELAGMAAYRHDSFGLYATSAAERARAAAELAWLASRLAWLESASIIATEMGV